MSITIKRRCDDGSMPKRRHRANTVSYRSVSYGHTCSFNPSFSVGAPWSIGVSITPECGDERVAKLGDAQKRARKAYQFRVGSVGRAFGWNDPEVDTAPTTLRLCTSAAAVITLRDTQGPKRAKRTETISFADPCVYS